MIIYSLILFLLSSSFPASASDCYHPSVALADIFRPAHPELPLIVPGHDSSIPYEDLHDDLPRRSRRNATPPAPLQINDSLNNVHGSLLYDSERHRDNLQEPMQAFLRAYPKKTPSDATLKINEICSTINQHGFGYYTGASPQPTVQKPSPQGSLASPQPSEVSSLAVSTAKRKRSPSPSSSQASSSNRIPAPPVKKQKAFHSTSVITDIYNQFVKDNYDRTKFTANYQVKADDNPVKKDPFRCSLCPMTFGQRNSLHVLTSHTKNIGVEDVLYCISCNTSFKSQKEFNQHKRATGHQNSKFSVDACFAAEQFIVDNK